jgi:ankyrin repeat protein
MARLVWLAFALLICACGSSSKGDRRAFLIAAENGDVRTVREQLGYGVGADDVFNIGDRTALSLAAMNAQVETVRVLLDAGADPNTGHEGGSVKLDVQGFQSILKGVHANPGTLRPYRKQDGTTIELSTVPLRDAEYQQILKMLDEAMARYPKK